MKSLSCSMKRLLSCSIVGFLALTAGDFCHAQNSELHVTVMWDGFGRGGLVPVTNFDIELSSEGYSYEGKYNHINTTAIYHDVPEGRLAIRIDNASLPEIKPFSDSITVHKGTNAVIIEMDSSGERKTRLTDFDGNELPIPPEYAQRFGTRPDGTYYVPRPVRPRTGSTTDGQRVLYSRVFCLDSGISNPAIEFMEENGWAKTGEVDFEPGFGLVLLDPDVHWSWKNGAYVFWKD